MNLEFHYWISLFVALKAGIDHDTAWCIACSSQLCDDRNIKIPLEGPRGKDYIPATHSYDIEQSKDADLIRKAYHFIPGSYEEANSIRSEGSAPPDVVTPNSILSKQLLISALKTRNPYRIGIALHAYADTWAHANFSASSHPGNILYPDDIIPPIGHAQALFKPDRLNEQWDDPRLLETEKHINNRKRFMHAARMIYKYLCTFNKRSYEDVDLMEIELELLWGSRGSKTGLERKYEYVTVCSVPDYDAALWFSEAGLPCDDTNENRLTTLIKKGRSFLQQYMYPKPLSIDSAYYQSRLYAWALAANAHLEEFKRYYSS